MSDANTANKSTICFLRKDVFKARLVALIPNLFPNPAAWLQSQQTINLGRLRISDSKALGGLVACIG